MYKQNMSIKQIAVIAEIYEDEVKKTNYIFYEVVR